jgi:hypothetical protein
VADLPSFVKVFQRRLVSFEVHKDIADAVMADCERNRIARGGEDSQCLLQD